jgi:hypothetical protein
MRLPGLYDAVIEHLVVLYGGHDQRLGGQRAEHVTAGGRMGDMGRCHNCGQELIEIDNRGELLDLQSMGIRQR